MKIEEAFGGEACQMLRVKRTVPMILLRYGTHNVISETGTPSYQSFQTDHLRRFHFDQSLSLPFLLLLQLQVYYKFISHLKFQTYIYHKFINFHNKCFQISISSKFHMYQKKFYDFLIKLILIIDKKKDIFYVNPTSFLSNNFTFISQFSTLFLFS